MAVSDRALAIDPNDTDALNAKAYGMVAMEEFNQAIALFDKVLAIEPNNTDALDGKRSLTNASAIGR
jgi:tetratricopeptide (TPR) repeat protein